MPSERKYEAKQTMTFSALEQIKRLDTSEYESSPMVERILVEQMEELKERNREFENELIKKSQEISNLRVRVATLSERRDSERILSWIRSFVGIVLGVSGGLMFSTDPLIDKTGVVLVPVFATLFLLTCIFSLRREKNGQR
ncbi:MAG: hypothetical protein HXS54_18810 [Theionarchaea archaeon]|nr:hypothetical protein [Theionarchaea archaeon]